MWNDLLMAHSWIVAPVVTLTGSLVIVAVYVMCERVVERARHAPGDVA